MHHYVLLPKNAQIDKQPRNKDQQLLSRPTSYPFHPNTLKLFFLFEKSSICLYVSCLQLIPHQSQVHKHFKTIYIFFHSMYYAFPHFPVHSQCFIWTIVRSQSVAKSQESSYIIQSSVVILSINKMLTVLPSINRHHH